MVSLTDAWANRDLLLAFRSWDEAPPAVRAFIDALAPQHPSSLRDFGGSAPGSAPQG